MAPRAVEFIETVEIETVERGRARVPLTSILTRTGVHRPFTDVAGSTRFTAGRSTYSSTGPVDLNRIIAQLVRQHQPQAAAAGCRLTFVPAANLPLVLGDCYALTQMLEALLCHAHPNTGGRLKITTSHAPTAAVVIIDLFDSRDGIHLAELAHAQPIVARHGGKICADSTPGLGSRCSIQLPSLA